MKHLAWATLLLLASACASAPAPLPGPHTSVSPPPSGPRLRLVLDSKDPALVRSRIGKADLEQARALLSRARKDLEPRQWEALDRKLTAAQRAFERFSAAARTSGHAAEVVRGAEGLAQAGRASLATSALSQVGPVLMALVLLWPASTAGPQHDSRPAWVHAQWELEARLRELAEASRQLMMELEEQSASNQGPHPPPPSGAARSASPCRCPISAAMTPTTGAPTRSRPTDSPATTCSSTASASTRSRSACASCGKSRPTTSTPTVTS